jgi:DNA-binding MarR family transcriptional regulator
MSPTQFIRLLKEIKSHLTLNFPFGGSSISEEITLKVLDAYFSGAELSVKNLFVDLPYSVMGIRHNFDRLLKDNWIECKKSDKDARVRLVFPTDNLLEKINLLSENFEKTFQELGQKE